MDRDMDKWMIHVPSRLEPDNERIHHSAQNCGKFKTCEWFVSGIFHLVFSDWSIFDTWGTTLMFHLIPGAEKILVDSQCPRDWLKKKNHYEYEQFWESETLIICQGSPWARKSNQFVRMKLKMTLILRWTDARHPGASQLNQECFWLCLFR